MVILVAEDEELIRAAISEYLQEAGFCVVEAANAADALSVLRSSTSVDLVFSDINMPGDMDGRELAAWLAVHRPSVPIILTSGIPRPGLPEGTQHRRFMPKPYLLGDLEDNIRQLLH